jgi:hypothetical protein
VFCDGVQHRLQFCPDHTNRVKMATFQLYLQSGKQRKVAGGPSQASRVGGGRQSCCFLVKNFLMKIKCETVLCRDATASSSVNNVQGAVFTHFHAVAVKCHSSMWNWLFGLPGRILYGQSPWCQRKLWTYNSMALLFTCLTFFGLGEFGRSMYGSCFLPWTLVWSLSGPPSHFIQDWHKIWCCTFILSIEKLLQDRNTTTNIRT